MLPLVALILALETAQYNTASIAGVVRDQQSGSVAGATVIAVHKATGRTTERTTDGNGRFVIPELAIGDYSLTVQRSGFAPFHRDDLALAIGQSLDVHVTLTVAPVSDAITVSAVAALDAAGSEMHDIITNREVVQLPLNGRQFLQLAQMTDGVAVPPGGTRGAALEQAGSLPAVLGQRSGHNIYLLDGVKVTDEYFNNLVVSPSVDGIEEFKIQKTMYAAEFGGKASALINVVTRSGANAFHGGAREFYRSDRFDARNFFDDPGKPVPPLSQHQFGASLGGPIARSRAFFFGDYEGQRLDRSLTQTFSVAPAAMRAGDFSSLPLALCDPATRTSSGCTPFSGNQIPASRLDPMAVALLAKVPLPTSPGTVQNLLAIGGERNPMDQFTGRFDTRLSQEDTLFARFTSYDVEDVQPFGTSALNETLVPGFGRSVTTHGRSLGVGHTHVFTASLLNELRFGFLHASGGQVSPNAGVPFAASVGLQGVTQDPRDTGYPQVAFGGLFSAIGDPTTFVSRDNRSYELYDNVTWDRGAHRIKAGGYLFYLQFNPVNPQAARGSFTFTGQWTGNAFADFLLGYPSAAQAGIGRADEHGRSTWFHAYGQDEWRLAPNLTLSYGLRYEINSQMADVDNRLSAIDVNVPGGRFVIASDDQGNMSADAGALLGQIPVPYTTSDAAGWTRGLLRPSYLRFAPRVSLAWSVDRDQRTVISGGYGVFLNQWAYSVQQALAQTLPFFFAKTVNAASDALQPPFSSLTMLTAPANGTVGGNTMEHDFRTEYAKNWNVILRRQVSRATSIEISYIHSDIVGADSSTVLNVPVPGPGAIGPRRPIPALANITAIRWDGYSMFDALTAKAERRLSNGLAFSGSYTLSKAVDDASDPGATSYETNLPQDVRNMAAERAVASFDHRHRIVGNVTYELPAFASAGSGWRSGLANGWRVNAILLAQSGAPFTVNLGTDRANVGSGPAQRPDATCDANAGGARTAAQWFDTSCFSLPAAFTFGNAARNAVYAPGYASLDLGVVKDVGLGPGRLELRLEAFNLLNTTNFDVPSRTAFTPNFGRIFSAGPARQLQLGAKFLF